MGLARTSWSSTDTYSHYVLTPEEPKKGPYALDEVSPYVFIPRFGRIAKR